MYVILAVFLLVLGLGRAEESGTFLSQGPFPRKVFFLNPSNGQHEERSFKTVEIDSEKNALFVLEDGTSLVLPTSRILAVIPIPPLSIEGFTLSDLDKGYLECSKASRVLPKAIPLVTQWANLVSAKKKRLESEKLEEQAAQGRAIQEAALKKVTEELAFTQKSIAQFDRLNDRKQIQQALESTKSYNPKLLGDPGSVEEAKRYWSFILSLPPRVPIPKQWPLCIPPKELFAISTDHEALSPKIFSYALLGGGILISLLCLSGMINAFRKKEWLVATFFFVLVNALLALGFCLFFIQPAQASSFCSEKSREFFEKGAWQQGDVLEAHLTRQKGKSELQLLVVLGWSYAGIPLYFKLDPDFGKPPQLLSVIEAHVGAFPMPNNLMQQVWSFLSKHYSWAQ